MQEQKDEIKMPHNIIMQGRNSLSISGVNDVDSFDEKTVIMSTTMGELTIHGENLHINRINVELGELSMDGIVCAIIYSDQPQKSQKKQSFFAKIMR